jgi:hypothetical protein
LDPSYLLKKTHTASAERRRAGAGVTSYLVLPLPSDGGAAAIARHVHRPRERLLLARLAGCGIGLLKKPPSAFFFLNGPKWVGIGLAVAETAWMEKSRGAPVLTPTPRSGGGASAVTA